MRKRVQLSLQEARWHGFMLRLSQPGCDDFILPFTCGRLMGVFAAMQMFLPMTTLGRYITRHEGQLSAAESGFRRNIPYAINFLRKFR
jgi:hypothetical protein